MQTLREIVKGISLKLPVPPRAMKQAVYYPKERVLLELVGTGFAAAQAPRWIFDQQFHDKVLDFG